MARVTVEDCVDKIKNRFELVVLVTQRAKAITSGAKITVERDNDKNAVVALREIASQNINPNFLRSLAVKSLNKDYSYDIDDQISDGHMQEEDLAKEAVADFEEVISESQKNLENQEIVSDEVIGEEIFFEDEDDAEE